MNFLICAEASVCPKSCAEELGYTFLPSVLAYLHRAPSLKRPDESLMKVDNDFHVYSSDVKAVVVPVSGNNYI